ncbi:MAG: preprotein translocase subunit YajC [Verrucomicrobiota bacterium]|nr:preprotein translocase subunit YajC [Verrucomicrobiota bacterium]|tara:strand:- start:691 stop:1014 length:324 start_codon:yes stop_codon:yes gene_type:complete
MLQSNNILFLDTLAMAPPPGESGGGLMGFLPMILIFVAFYFLLIAPQRKKQKQHQKMINALEKGDSIKTIGGVFGKITGVKDDRVVVQIAENVKVEVAKEAVSAKVD